MSTVSAARAGVCAAVLLALTIAGPLTSPAAAAVLSTDFQNAADEGYEGIPYALLTTAAGARTDLLATRLTTGWRFADAASPLTIAPDSRCAATGDPAPTAVQCAVDKVFLKGEAGDDVLRADGKGGGYGDPLASFSGEGGNDTIVGGPEGDQVVLTAGHDTVDTGDGVDELVVRYPGPSTVDLVAGTATSAAGSAELRGIEAVTGTNATIVGDDGDNVLATNAAADGGRGDDVLRGDGTLRGGPGDDRITGAESLFGDAGDDTIVVDRVDRVVADPPDPRVACGAGTDAVVVGDGYDLRVQADCEHLRYGPAIVRPTPVRADAGRAVAVSIRCGGCRGTLRLRTGHGSGATVRYVVRSGSRSFRVPVPRGTRVRSSELVAVTMRPRTAEQGPVVWRTTVR